MMFCGGVRAADVIDEDVPELLAALQKDDTAAMRPAVQVQMQEEEAGSDGEHSHMDTYGDDYHDDYHDDYGDLEDEHGEKRRPAIPEYKEAEATEEGVEEDSAATVYTASNCRLLKAETDDRLAPFCALETKDLRRFVVNYLISRKVSLAERKAPLCCVVPRQSLCCSGPSAFSLCTLTHICTCNLLVLLRLALP